MKRLSFVLLSLVLCSQAVRAAQKVVEPASRRPNQAAAHLVELLDYSLDPGKGPGDLALDLGDVLVKIQPDAAPQPLSVDESDKLRSLSRRLRELTPPRKDGRLQSTAPASRANDAQETRTLTAGESLRPATRAVANLSEEDIRNLSAERLRALAAIIMDGFQAHEDLASIARDAPPAVLASKLDHKGLFPPSDTRSIEVRALNMQASAGHALLRPQSRFKDDASGVVSALSSQITELLSLKDLPYISIRDKLTETESLIARPVRLKTASLLREALSEDPQRFLLVAERLKNVATPGTPDLGATVSAQLEQLKSRIGENMQTFELIKLFGKPLPLEDVPFELDFIFDSFKSDAAEDKFSVPEPEGFHRQSIIIDSRTMRPLAVYSKEAAAHARRKGLVFNLDRDTIARLEPHARYNYVIIRNAHGRVSMIVGKKTARREAGVKHIAIAADQETLFAGGLSPQETGRVRLDFMSGSFSDEGTDNDWNYLSENILALAAYAEAILGVPIEIFDPFKNVIVFPE